MFIDHCQSIDPRINLNNSKLHLNSGKYNYIHHDKSIFGETPPV